MFAVADDDSFMLTEARKLLAWEAIRDEEESQLDDMQRQQLKESIGRAQRDLRESVWRSYKNVLLLDKKNELRTVDLGLLNSSQSPSITKLIVDRLRQEGDLELTISPNFLVRNWPPAFTEWATKNVRDSFFASPQFPRLLDGETLRQTIAKGVQERIIAYSSKSGGASDTLQFDMTMQAGDVEISDDTFILRAEDAKKRAEPVVLREIVIRPDSPNLKPGAIMGFQAEGRDQHDRPMVLNAIEWHASGGVIDASGRFNAGKDEGVFSVEAVSSGSGEQRASQSPKMTLSGRRTGSELVRGISWSRGNPSPEVDELLFQGVARFATAGGIKLRVSLEVSPEGGLPEQKVEETNAALRELGVEKGGGCQNPAVKSVLKMCLQAWEAHR